MNNAVRAFLVMSLLVAVVACGKRPGADPTSAEQSAVAASPKPETTDSSVPASQYEGKVVRRVPVDGSKEDGWFYVKDGKRHWIVDSNWLATQGLKPEDVIEIPGAALKAIPEDPQAVGASKQ